MSDSAMQDYEDIFSQDDYILQLKKIIQHKYEVLNNQFDPLKNVNKLLIENAKFIDNILSLCWKHSLKQHSNHLCLIATGGYGREEIFPNSDIDILILLKSSDTNGFQDGLSSFCNLLWDIGLKPGQSVRTIPECIKAASEDQTIATNLLETRQICGNNVLYHDLKNQVSLKALWPTEQFFAAKMQEQVQRYTKYHDTAYNLEPNIKEGPGGLRDLQNIAWVFKHHYGSSTLKELIKYGFFSEQEYTALMDCRNILWRIRFALHLLTKRCEDRLLFDYQRDLANQFGFTDKNKHPDVEQFMQYYFKTVMELESMNEMLLQLFNEKIIDTIYSAQAVSGTDHFVSINGYLEAKESDTFEKHPIALLEIFSILQQNPDLKGTTASTIRLVRKNLPLIDDTYRQNPQANQVFLSILSSSNGITKQLRKMNRYGVLAAYLPPFAHIVARMQYDLFHIYTVDAHTLFVLRNLRRFSLDKHKDELPFCNSIFMHIAKPEILYIAALFHDIAKGMGGDHSVLGEDIAEQFCLQHSLSRHDRKLITWLVRNHLVMSMTAQRKDITDPEIIHKFALQVSNIEYLNHLYLFTVADIRATNPSLWNSWKDSLLSELYTSTHNALHRGLQNPIKKSEQLYENKQEARDELIGLGISQKTIDKTWQKIGDDYFLRYSAEEIAWHTIAIASTTKDQLPLVLLRPQNHRGSVEVFVYTQNENSVFSICADTLDQLGLNILDARIVTMTLSTTEQYALNSFQVLEQSGESIKDLYRETHICQILKENLENRLVKVPTNIHRESRQAIHFPISSKVHFHKDPLSRYTIIELITTDHAGLLATVGRVFSQLDIQLHSAKITTIGSRVEDMFYVTDEESTPITDEEKLEKLRQSLISVLKESHLN